MGNLDVIVAGSGIGQLIDGFVDRLKEKLNQDQASDIYDVKRVIERRLPHFLNNEVANYPISDDAKLHKFIVAAYSPSTRQFEVWASRHTRLVAISTYELAGVEDVLYDHIAKRFLESSATLSFSQAVLIGLYLLTIAEATSSSIRSPFQVAAIWSGGIELEKSENIEAITQRLAVFEKDITKIFLSCADTTVPVPDLEDYIDQFKNNASALHRVYIDQQTPRACWREEFRGHPLKKLPSDPLSVTTDVQTGETQWVVEHDRAKLVERREHLKVFKEIAAGRILEKDVACTCGHIFHVTMDHSGLSIHHLSISCPHCGHPHTVTWDDNPDFKYLEQIAKCVKCKKAFTARVEDEGKDSYGEREVACFRCGEVQKVNFLRSYRLSGEAFES